MKLQKLAIRNFLGQAEFEHEFVEMITIFAGANDAGKTSIRDAIAVAGSGTTRGISKNARSCMARGPEGFDILATFDIEGRDMDFHSTTTGDSPAPGDRAKWLGSKDLIYHLTDHRAWELVGKDKRHKLLNALVPQEEWRGTALPADLEHTRNDRGIHACMTAATNQRRGMKRQMDEYGVPTKPDPIVLIEGLGNINLNSRKLTDVQSEIMKLKKDSQRIATRMTKAVILTETGAEKEKELTGLAAKIPVLEAAKSEATERRIPLNKAATTAGSQRNIVEDKRASALAELNQAQKMVDIGKTCAACGNELEEGQVKFNLTALADCKENYNGYNINYRNAVTEWNEANACASRAKQDELDAGVLLKEAKNAEKELATYREQIEEAKAEGLDYSKLEVELGNVQSRRDGLIQVEAAINNLVWQEENYEKTLANMTRMTNNMKSMEQICASIEENVKYGSRDVMAVCTKQIKSLGEYFGKEIKLADDYMPGMDGIPFQLLCESHQYLGLVAVQYALALVSGVGFVFIDSLDRLTSERIKLLRRWMQLTVVDSGVQIIAAVARDDAKAIRQSPFHVVPLGVSNGDGSH